MTSIVKMTTGTKGDICEVATLIVFPYRTIRRVPDRNFRVLITHNDFDSKKGKDFLVLVEHSHSLVSLRDQVPTKNVLAASPYPALPLQNSSL